MSHRITPILIKESKEFDWKISKKKSALENLSELLDKVSKEVRTVRAQKISVSKEQEKRAKLQKAVTKMGTNLESLLALKEVANSDNILKLNKELKKKTDAELSREFLFLVKNIEKLRNNSTAYEEAWREIESEYFLKVSLYNAEILRREG